MTVYAVSQEYLDELNNPFLPPASLEAELLNLDASAQAEVSVDSYTGAILGSPVSNIVQVSAEHMADLATLEPDRMMVDGNYEFSPNFYISGAVSASSPDSNGEYTIENISVTLSFADGKYIDCPLTIEAPAAARIIVEISYGYVGNIRTFSNTYTMDSDSITLTDLPNQELYRSIKISVSSLRRSQWRSHIRKVYFGTAQVLESDDILSMDYIDTSDGMMLELPQRKATISVSNTGQYDLIAENENPSFRKWHTQAVLRMSQDLSSGGAEWIPLGRFFMESYAVTEEKVTFVFQSAIGLLNDFTYFWERNTSSVSQKMDDVFYLDTEMISNGVKPQTTAEEFALTLDRSSAINMNTTTSGNGPLVSNAAFIQILANVTGNLLRPKRVGEDMELIGIQTESDPVRTLKEDRCFNGLGWTAPERTGSLTINCMSKEEASHSETIATDAILNSQDLSIYSAQGELVPETVSFEYDSSSEGSPYVADTFVHCIYAGVYKIDNLPDVTIKTNLYSKKTVKTGTWSYTDGKDESLSNPFISSSGPLSAGSFAGRIYEELKNNIIGTLDHRGYPEIDAGDIILIIDDKNGDTRARVLENRLTLNNGILTGKTKVRRLYGGT